MALDCSLGKQIFFNLVEGYFQSFLHIYINIRPCPLLVIYFCFFFFCFFVIQINLKHFDGWSIQ